MNYRRIYNDLIMRGWRRTALEGYCEKHHIIPKCIGGDNCKSNLVKLTAEEHFIAHLLLTRMYPDEYKLNHALVMMCGRAKKNLFSNKLYAKVRKRVGEHNRIINTGREKSIEARQKLSKALKGKKQSQEWIDNRVASFAGYKHSPETRLKLSKISSNMTEERKQKIAKTLTGRKDSEATKEKKRIASTGRLHTEEAKMKMRGKRNESPETKVRRSLAKKGFKHSEESRLKMSESQKGHTHSEETKLKISAACKGVKWGSHTEEAKIKMSISHKGKKCSPETKAKMSESAKLRCQRAKDKKEILQFWCAL